MVEVGFELNEELTRYLWGSAHSAFNTQITDLLLAGLYKSICGLLGEGSLVVEMKGSSRKLLREEIDVSRTIGCFTSIYPVCLSGEITYLSTLVKSIKESIRKVPQNGMDYLFYQYLDPETGWGIKARTDQFRLLRPN